MSAWALISENDIIKFETQNKERYMSKDYSIMSKDELSAELRRLKNELEDLEDTFQFNLANTSAHLSSGAVTAHEEEIAELKEQIAKVESLLAG